MGISNCRVPAVFYGYYVFVYFVDVCNALCIVILTKNFCAKIGFLHFCQYIISSDLQTRSVQLYCFHICQGVITIVLSSVYSVFFVRIFGRSPRLPEGVWGLVWLEFQIRDPRWTAPYCMISPLGCLI